MNVTITVAVIAAAVSAIGWVVTYMLARRAERVRIRLTARLAHIQKQLEELYGPLVFLVYEGRATFADLWTKLGPNSIFADGRQLSDAELKTWLFWVDHEFMPRNGAIQQLLATKTHLIEGDGLPASHVRFLDHYNNWKMDHLRWKEEDMPYSWHSKVDWPAEFESEIIATFERLKKSHAMLLGAVGRV